MKHFIFFLLLPFAVAGQDYFQQEVNYKIKVTLNDKAHTLSGFETFDYVNHSPNELHFIYIHLWPNAYKDNTSAMSLQQYRNGNKVMENNTTEDRGFIDSLDFKINGESATFLYNLSHRDIGKLVLNKPLKTGESITVSTPFKVKLPNGNISRLGHVGESYQITQWYPKPAVYDKDGWHEMPYLTQGEFYSEYGSFDVVITLPKNYVVGATGDLQTTSEIEFLSKKAEETKRELEEVTSTADNSFSNKFPPSSDTLKTLRFKQSNVHDFAWFADKRYKVLKGEVKLPNSQRTVTTWAMFTPKNSSLWKNAIEYLNDGTYWYSKWNGDYPYNQVTAVDGTISAGGGMEYPNVTVIGTASSATQLELVIVHEVGHNWFYGILGSNERVHPWMDEGINTANEIRYFQTKYPENEEFSANFGGIADKIHLGGISHHCGNHMTYGFSANNGKDQPIELHSNEYTSLNYGAIVYAKTGLVFTYLRDYLGDEVYDKGMKAYFEKWKFKHPQPKDIQEAMEKASGKELNWLFDDILNTTGKIDFKLRKVRTNDKGETKVEITNVGDIRSPVRVDAFSEGKKIESVWTESTPNFEVMDAVFYSQDIDEVRIDADENMPDVNRMNNSWKKSRMFNKIERINFEFMAGDNESDKNTVWWTPIIGANAYDNFMAGMVFHNISVPKNKLEFYLAPMYSFGNNCLTGMGDVHLNFAPARVVNKIEVGVKAQAFGEEKENKFLEGSSFTLPNSFDRTFYRVIKPYVNFEFWNKYRFPRLRQQIRAEFISVNNHTSYSNVYDWLGGGFLDYNLQYKKRKVSLKIEARLDVKGTEFLIPENSNFYLTVTNNIAYKVKKEKNIEVRLFVGQNIFERTSLLSPQSDPNYGFALGGQNGTQDYFYEQLMMGRNEIQGLWAQQRVENHGAFKTVSDFGLSSSFMASANVYAELPWGPIGIFGDYGVFHNGSKLITAANAGLGIRLLNGNVSAYFPLFQTNNIQESLNDKKYIHTVRFTFNLSNLSYQRILRGL